MLGDRRGWLLLIIQPIAIVAVGALSATLIDGTRWLVIFAPLIALITIWIAQAVDAYQRALRMGAQRGGEMAVVAVLPIVLTVLTAFWLLGGRHSSPTATLQDYIQAWIDNRPEAAASLFATPRTADEVGAEWTLDQAQLRTRIDGAALIYGSDSGLDPESPFDSLRFGNPVFSGDGHASIDVELVRNERVETTVLGIIPTAGQQTVIVERDMTIWLEQQRQPRPSWLPIDGLDSYSWKISRIDTSST